MGSRDLLSWAPLFVVVGCGAGAMPPGTTSSPPQQPPPAVPHQPPPAVPQPPPGPNQPPPGPSVQPPPVPDPPPAGSNPSTGTPAAGVSIAGVQLARDQVVVFLHIGHSNMAGRASSPPELRPFNYDIDPHLWSYARGGQWKPAREPLSGDNMTEGRAGPGMSILHAALALAPDKYMVSIGHGHSGLTGGFCRNYRRGALLYNLVMDAAVELKGRVTFGAIFTMFGTSEINDRPNLAQFGECMKGVASDMRADLGEPDLPFVVGDWEANAMTDLTVDSPTGRIIVPQLRAIPANVSRAAVIPTEDLPILRNDHHYDLTGYKQWAERGLAIMNDKAWIPWATR
jgi:hypothetical protein